MERDIDPQPIQTESVRLNEHQEDGLQAVDRGTLLAETETQKKTHRALSKKSIIIGSSALFILLAICTSLFIYHHEEKKKYAALLNDYNAQYQLVFEDAKTFVSQMKDGPSEKRNLKSTIAFYRNLMNSLNFDKRMDSLNFAEKYDKISDNDRKPYASLGVDSSISDLKTVSADLDKIQGVLQKSTNIDNEIKLLLTQNMTIGDIDKKADDLTKRNAAINDELLGIVVHTKLKEAQEIFIEALSYRGSYLSQMKAANSAYLDSLVAKASFEENNKTMAMYRDEGDAAVFTSTKRLYYNYALDYAKKAEDELKKKIEKEHQAADLQNQANQSLIKYVELAQIDIDISKLKSNGNSGPQPSPDSAKAKLNT